MNDYFILGIDVGSITVKTALVKPDSTILSENHTRIKGDALLTLMKDLNSIFTRFPEERIRAAGITGGGGKQIADAIGARHVNEILSQAAFVDRFHPGASTVIELGGEDAKLISLDSDRAANAVGIRDFSMNTACAAGTGSFLDQQASRLKLTIEEFSSVSLRSKIPPRIAGRCSVFAKSDMIHLQQIATPDYDIVAGLCFAMARNFKATVGKGRKFIPPILFLGGVAANLGMRRAFKEVLGLADKDLIVPEHFNTSGAIGAALMVMKDGGAAPAYKGISGLVEHADKESRRINSGAESLRIPKGIMPNPGFDAPTVSDALIDAYLGIDVGSVSTNVVVIDRHMRLLSKRYLPTAGRPIEAVKQGLAEVGDELGSKVRILGAGTTGSGRYLTGDMIGADIVRNEITAQTTAAVEIDPGVDTIFEIGGQDSKYISLDAGAIVDFEMNKACAAGTGSFLEEQADRLGIGIRETFAERAFCATSPCGLGERCTVFMESDLVHYLNKGSSVEDLTAGLAYSIAHNYLNKVVAGKRIGLRIFFQGGVAANKAVVAAFEKITGKNITVPPHHEVTGAIGAAILAMRESPAGRSGFKGFDLSKRSYAVATFECRECSNRCDIRKVSFDGEQPLFYGSRCEKYDVKKKSSVKNEMQDLFAERERLLGACGPAADNADVPTIGIPRMLLLNDLLPFWRSFFSGLGYKVILSERTNRLIINRGLEASLAESCFPSKVALGHIQDLLDKKADILFLPSFIRFPSAVNEERGSQACPYVQALPYIAKASLSFGGTKILMPALYLHDRKNTLMSLRGLGASLGKGPAVVRRALDIAQRVQAEFHIKLAELAKAALSAISPDQKALVLIGRSYNTCDTGLNMNLPAKIRDLGVQAIPMDFLPTDGGELSGWKNMYWLSGQRIIAASRFIRAHPRLFPVYITNFGCGPDSFITHFFRHELAGKPFLQLEVDEHSADAGAITRIEAFLDSLKNAGGAPLKTFSIGKHGAVHRRKVYLPFMSDHAHILAAAFRSCGMEAEALPESDGETVRLGKEHSSGRECYPLALTVGDMIKATRRPGFDPDRSAFFMPTGKGPCRFGQYHLYHRQVLDNIGLGKVPIFSPMQDETMHRDVQMLDRNFVPIAWRGALSVDLLQKACRELRPYEIKRGECGRVYQGSLHSLEAAVERREDLLPVLERAYREFSALELTRRDKPVIGVVGEIYIRSNKFSNEDIVSQIEAFGGEAWVAPVSEWLLYVTATSKASAKINRAWRDLLKTHLTEMTQQRDEKRFLSRFDGNLRSLHEPTISQTLEMARPYIHHSFEGEAVLSIGKAVDYIRRGVSGIVNVMPLTCMPGTIASAILKRVQENHRNIPLLNIAYEGQKDTHTLTRLEAFMHQARMYRERTGRRL